jgi:hypothetical protein
MKLRHLPLGLALVVIASVSAVPISTDDSDVVWVTETVYPCGPSPMAVAAVGKGLAVEQGGYDTVPVDGSDNSEGIVQEDPGSSSTTGEVVATPVVVFTAIEVTTGPIKLDAQFTSERKPSNAPSATDIPEDFGTTNSADHITASADPSPISVDPPAMESVDPVNSVTPIFSPTPTPTFPMITKSYHNHLGNGTYAYPTKQAILPTYPSNSTNGTCTDLYPDDEWSSEDDAYWSTASDDAEYWSTATDTLYYSDYTVVVTVHSSSVLTIHPTGVSDPASNATVPIAMAFATSSPFSNSTTTVVVTFDPIPTYTLESTAQDPVAVSANTFTPSTQVTVMPPTTSTPITMPAATMDPMIETSSGTIITYIDDTTTITGSPTTSTVTANVAAASDDITSTTTVWITSEIIVDAKRLKRGILVTRSPQ